MARRMKHSDIERASALEFGSYAAFKRGWIRYLRGDGSALCELSNLPDYDVCRCLHRSLLARSRRLKMRLAPMIKAGAYFVTLTFSDASLAGSTPAGRRIAVRRFLKGLALDYVANKDFGDIHQREHYHAVISNLVDSDRLEFVHDSKGGHTTIAGWDYGFSNWERIGSEDGHDDLRFVSRYLAKLKNHAIKESASSEMMVFSKRRN